MRRIALKWLALVVLIGGLAALIGAARSASRPAEVHGTLVATACSPTSPDIFCVSSPSSGPTVIPGANTPNLTLTFSNPTSSTLTVTSLTISFANTNFPSGCPIPDFEVDGNPVPSASPQAVTVAVPNLSVPTGTNASPGTATFPVTLSLLNDPNVNQTSCLGLALNMGYSASAQVQTVSGVNTKTAPTITSANTTTFTVGSAGTFTMTTTGSPTATLLESGALPSGVTFHNNGDGTATLAGTPAARTAGTYPLSITASNAVAPNATQSFSLVVKGATSSGTPGITGGGSGGSATASSSGLVMVPGVSVACPAGSAGCTIAVTVTTIVTTKSHKKTKRHTVTIGSARFKIAGGHTARIALHLTKAGLHLLTTKRRLKVTAKITVTNQTGKRSTTITRTFTLIAPAATHRKHTGFMASVTW
jgi:hypothetical protein